MKKLFIILLLVFYGSASFGMSLHFHFCCGELASVDLRKHENKSCHGEQEPSDDSKCCDDQKLELRINGEQHLAQVLSPVLHWTSLPPTSYTISPLAAVQKTILVPEVFAPPPVNKDLNRLYCIFRI